MYIGFEDCDEWKEYGSWEEYLMHMERLWEEAQRAREEFWREELLREQMRNAEEEMA